MSATCFKSMHLDIHHYGERMEDTDGIREELGLVQIYTGNGKGKTTAAFGLAMRAAGRGLGVLIVQFLKPSDGYGEQVACNRMGNITLVSMGLDHFVSKKPSDADIEAAHKALRTHMFRQIRRGRTGREHKRGPSGSHHITGTDRVFGKTPGSRRDRTDRKRDDPRSGGICGSCHGDETCEAPVRQGDRCQEGHRILTRPLKRPEKYTYMVW